MTAEPLDSADLDALLDLEQHPGYTLLVGRIGWELDRRRTELEQDQSADATALLRGKIAALRLALAIPGILRDEITNSIKE